MSKPLGVISLAVACGLVVTTGTSLSAQEKNVWTSPDGVLVARAKNFKETGSADYTDWDVVTVRDRQGKLLASISLEKGSGISPATVTEAVWSPDSRFLVFQTASSGGHSVWHEPAYIYDAATSRIYSIDDTIGAITSDNSPLRFTDGDTIRVQLYNSRSEKDSSPFSFPKDLPLPNFIKNAKVALHSIRPDVRHF